MVLVNGLDNFFTKGKPAFSNDIKSLPRNLSHCTILDNWVFDNFILTDELFAETLQSLGTYVLDNNNLCEKLVSWVELSITFGERFKVTLVQFLFLILIY